MYDKTKQNCSNKVTYGPHLQTKKYIYCFNRNLPNMDPPQFELSNSDDPLNRKSSYP